MLRQPLFRSCPLVRLPWRLSSSTRSYGLAIRSLDPGPSLTDCVDCVLRQRHVVEFGSCGAAICEGPIEELQYFPCRFRIGRVRWDQNEARSHDWPTVGARLVG